MKHLKAETTYDSSESFIPSPTSPPSQPHQLCQGREEGVVIERKSDAITSSHRQAAGWCQGLCFITITLIPAALCCNRLFLLVYKGEN